MPAAIRRIADFIGRKLSDETVKKIADHCYVDQMRDNPMTNGEYLRPFFQFRTDCGGFINKGKWLLHVSFEKCHVALFNDSVIFVRVRV